MARALKPGDQVRWNTPQGETQGKVVRKLTSKTKVKGHTATRIPVIRSIWFRAKNGRSRGA